MIATLMKISWTELLRDRAVQVLAFVVPIVFFSIFAVIFGGRGGATAAGPVSVAVVDASKTPASAALVAALKEDAGLRVVTDWARSGAAKGAPRAPMTLALAEELVRGGAVPVALVLPAGIDTSLGRFDARGAKALILTDPAEPIAPKMVAGLLQRATLKALRQQAHDLLGTSAANAPPIEDMMPMRTEERAVVGEKRTNSMVSFYAAGIAVMFLMFSAAASGGALLEETEAGTLERVLSSGVSMRSLLAGKWLYSTSRGIAQIVIMFVWGMLVFKLPLLSHLPGFAIMTVCTAMCAAAFGIALATAAKSRQQLQGLTNLFVLSLSAIGGSMFPRFLMSEGLQKASLIGFNAWALDGFLKVFWREAPLVALWPQVFALLGFTALFLFVATRFARRWEAV